MIIFTRLLISWLLWCLVFCRIRGWLKTEMCQSVHDRGESCFCFRARPCSSPEKVSFFCMHCWCTLQRFFVYFCHSNIHFQFLASLVPCLLFTACVCVCNEQCEHSERGIFFLYFLCKEESVEAHFMQEEMIPDNTKEVQVVSLRPSLAKKVWTTSWCYLKLMMLNSTLMYPKWGMLFFLQKMHIFFQDFAFSWIFLLTGIWCAYKLQWNMDKWIYPHALMLPWLIFFFVCLIKFPAIGLPWKNCPGRCLVRP